MLNSLFSNTISSINIWTILICSVVSIILGMGVALTHRFTSKYNKNFLVTLTLLPFIVQVIIIMVNGNLGTSVAILGAFSLVRFRSLPGTSKEILSVFFAMTIGLATGMGHILFASIFTILGCLVILIFNLFKLYDKNPAERILKIVIPEDLDYTEVFKEEFSKYTKENKLEKVKSTNMGSLFDLTYRIVLNNDVNEKEFIDDLRVKNGNLNIVLSQVIEECDL